MKKNSNTNFIFFYILALTIIFMIMPSSHAAHYEDKEYTVDIEKLLDEMGSSLVRIQISGWIMINDEYMSLEDLEDLAHKALINYPNYDFSIISLDETEHIRQAKVNVKADESDFVMTFNNGSHPSNQTSFETYVVIDTTLIAASRYHEVLVRETMEKLLRGFSDAPSISTTYIAGIPGRLGTMRMNKAASQIFHKLKGKIIEGIQTDQLISKTGYTDSFNDFLTVDGEKVNINVALRYNAYDDITYIWLGTPIISIAY